jgi:hypothetical protein
MVQQHSNTPVLIDEWDMRKLYNLGGFERRIRKGIWSGQIVKSTQVDPASKMIGRRTPQGSHNQKVLFFDEAGNDVANVHRFITPLGKLGGWGTNDPKRIVIAGVTYHQTPKDAPVPVLKNKAINRILDRHGLAAAWTYVYWLNGRIQKRWKQFKKRLGADID